MRGSPKFEIMQDAAGETMDGRSMIVTDDADGSYAVWAVQLSGTFSATVTFEGTVNGSTWIAIEMKPLATPTLVTTATAAGIFRGNVAGLTEVRARVSAFTSGEVTAHGQLSCNGVV